MDIPGVSKDKGPADTPTKKKHREQLIVVGTLVLVLLTFMMVARRGSSAPAGEPTTGAASDPTADGVGGVAGGGGGSDMYAWLPAAMAGMPGQVAALTQAAQARILRNQRAERKRELRILANQRRMQHELMLLRHPHRPKHPITVHHKSAPHRGRPTHHTRTSPFPKPGTPTRTY